GYHDARILAVYLDEHSLITEEQMETWVKDFDSWDVCDQCCGNLFDKTKFAYKKAVQWTKPAHEFTRRAGFALMASLAVHDKKADDSEFIKFLPLIKKYSTDERNFVKKAVNWALRQIGKRNASLNKAAIGCANEILLTDNKAARWIANDALRELKSEAVREKLGIRKF
ncbi:MAG: DNA alkylation repair protein, partial [Ignavibacteria bacterium]